MSMMYLAEPSIDPGDVVHAATMPAIVQRGYGAPRAVLELAEVEIPSPRADEVLVHVRAASVNPADWHVVRGEPYVARLALGVLGPKARIPGCDLAGRVVAVGTAVRSLRPGDEVFGAPFPAPFGAFAEYACVPAHRLARKPATLPFAKAAALPIAACTALQAVRDHARVGAGDRVLVVGASGGVGCFAVQIASSLGAEVTGVCSGPNVELVRSFGAFRAIDYGRVDITDPDAIGSGYDVVIQLAGPHSASDVRRILGPQGTHLMLSGDGGRWLGPVGRIAAARTVSPLVGPTATNFTVDPTTEDLVEIGRMTERDELSPLVSATHPLDDAPRAISVVERGHTRGKIVVTV